MMHRDMLGRNEAISVKDALTKLLTLPFRAPPVENIPIEEAYSRILSFDLDSPEDMPGFSRSTMDGYAVKASDTYGCSESVPAYLKFLGEVRMGALPDLSVQRGGAVLIMTGGMLPEGADSVVMLEHVQRSGDDMIEILRPVAEGENIVRAGEDIKKGDAVLKRGHKLRPQDIAALAGLGVTHVEVSKKPTVAIISTGDEVVPHHAKLQYGKVRDINSFNLSGLIDESGAIPEKLGIFPDNYKALKNVIENAIESHDMVLISGGSSVGNKDMTARILDSIEPDSVLFHGVAVKPGKPLIGGFVLGKPVFGLPGHPAAVTVSYLNFVRPLLLKISGYAPQDKENLSVIKATLKKNISSAPGREDHVRVAIYKDEGKIFAVPILGKSGLINTLVQADGIVVIPAHAQGLAGGEMVDVRLF